MTNNNIYTLHVIPVVILFSTVFWNLNKFLIIEHECLVLRFSGSLSLCECIIFHYRDTLLRKATKAILRRQDFELICQITPKIWQTLVLTHYFSFAATIRGENYRYLPFTSTNMQVSSRSRCGDCIKYFFWE